MKNKKIPMRRCVGCMTSFPKDELERFANDDGEFSLDETGRKNGRGFYLCKSLECFDKAVKRKRIGGTIKYEFTVDSTKKLREEYENMLSAREVNE